MSNQHDLDDWLALDSGSWLMMAKGDANENLERKKHVHTCAYLKELRDKRCGLGHQES